MSKHFSLFQTEAQYQAAKENLDFPNVSLIDTTGDLHYATYPGKEIADAAFGDIILADKTTELLFYLKDSDYDTTIYPLSDFDPIAVCIFDKASNANGQTVFMSVKWADYTNLGVPNTNLVNMTYGFNNQDLSEYIPEIKDTGNNHISSYLINKKVKNYITIDYSGSSISSSANGPGESQAFCACFRYKTTGTKEGDWMLPSVYDLSKLKNNKQTILNVLTSIKNKGLNYIDGLYAVHTCCQKDATKYYRLISNNNTIQEQLKTENYCQAKPVFIAGINEL